MRCSFYTLLLFSFFLLVSCHNIGAPKICTIVGNAVYCTKNIKINSAANNTNKDHNENASLSNDHELSAPLPVYTWDTKNVLW